MRKIWFMYLVSMLLAESARLVNEAMIAKNVGLRLEGAFRALQVNIGIMAT